VGIQAHLGDFRIAIVTRAGELEKIETLRVTGPYLGVRVQC
jgi:hypothetical protein